MINGTLWDQVSDARCALSAPRVRAQHRTIAYFLYVHTDKKYTHCYASKNNCNLAEVLVRTCTAILLKYQHCAGMREKRQMSTTGYGDRFDVLKNKGTDDENADLFTSTPHKSYIHLTRYNWSDGVCGGRRYIYLSRYKGPA